MIFHRDYSLQWQLAELIRSATDAAATVKHALSSVIVIPHQKINTVFHCPAHCTETSSYSVLSKLLTYIRESRLRISGRGNTVVDIACYKHCKDFSRLTFSF